MTEDLVERLRTSAEPNMVHEAADRIEKLEQALRTIAAVDIQSMALDALRPGARIAPKETPMKINHTYLGDNAFASFDGHQIHLSVYDHRNVVVYLDADVYNALVAFGKRAGLYKTDKETEDRSLNSEFQRMMDKDND